jgi:hypothetical protein
MTGGHSGPFFSSAQFAARGTGTNGL